MGGTREHAPEYFAASAMAAAINYPLWRVSAIGQSGFHVNPNAVSTTISIPRTLAPYLYAFAPPYKGMLGTILGMTWARAGIFYGSDLGKETLKNSFPTLHPSIYTLLPPFVVSTAVQVINQPIVRATVTLQDPQSNLPNIRASIRHIYRNFGLAGLWHGTSAGVLKTVPKYCTAILVKDYMDRILPHPDPDDSSYHTNVLIRSAIKSAAAGLAGAVLTNPLDVIRNEMFKTNHGMMETTRNLKETLGWKFIVRGMGKNVIAVSLPVASTIFFTDALIDMTEEWKKERAMLED